MSELAVEMQVTNAKNKVIGPIVYIVDDDASVRKSLTRLMRSVGYDAETFASAEEFLARSPRPPGYLVLDVQLPGKSGLELQQELVESGDKIPITFITAHEDEQLRNKAMASGAKAFLHKPFDDYKLLDTIQAFLGPGKIRGRGREPDQE